MNGDAELAEWREQWQAETSIPADLKRKVERHSLLMKVGLAGDVLVTLVIGGGTSVWAWRDHDANLVPVAIAAWVFLVLAWVFVLLANRGLWSPSATDAVSFVDLSIRRCRSALATIWFAAALFLAEIVFGLTWSYLHLAQPRAELVAWLLFSSYRIDIVWGITVAFFIGVVWYRRKKSAELVRLLAFANEIGRFVKNGQ